jgi:pimeloyl-ACP methyl ester carboxylesterase
MPIAPVDTNGTELSFEDSGAVPGSTDYTTLVIYHGSAFTGHTFDKLLSLGATNNIRLVILSRRDYAGSTKYSDDNLKDLNAGDKSFMERLGLEVAYFLLWFAQKHKVPKVSADLKSGGFAVMGWSMGNATPMALLAYPDVIGKETYAKLDPYFRQLILYDPPFLTFGYDQPPEGYDPFTDPDLPTQQAIFENFSFWVSGYYNHPDLASRSIHGLNFDKRGARPSIDNMTPQEMSFNFDGVAAARTEFPMFFQMQPTLKELAQLVLFNEKHTQEVLPNLQVVYISCMKAQWYCVWGMIETEKQHKENIAQGRMVRPIRFIEIEGANHFVHWDDPKAFWSAAVDGISN